MSELAWKPDWKQTQETFKKWWQGKELALAVIAPRDASIAPSLPDPGKPTSLEQQWLDIDWRVKSDAYHVARTWYGGVAFPHLATNFGPGSLGLFLGCDYKLEPDSIWFEPVMEDYESWPEFEFKPAGTWWQRHVDYIRKAQTAVGGKAAVTLPDIIENVDVLAALRGTDNVLFDVYDNPEHITERVNQIDSAWFKCYDALYEILKSPDGGVFEFAFMVWGPGKTCKIQCDISCMMSPDSFKEFVVPSLTKQCQFLDYSLYHLDGTTALHHVDALLAIDELMAIEWTPQSGVPQGGSPEWYDLYRRILDAGKCVQAVGVLPEEVQPLIDACGRNGMYIRCQAESETQGRQLIDTYYA